MKKLFALLTVAVMAASLTACGGVDITRVGLPETATLEKGATLQLEIDYGTDEDASLEAIAEAAQKLEPVWMSSDESVATVNASGLVTAVAGGEASITASIKDGNVSSSCKVTVAVPVTGVTASESLELVINGEDSANVDAQLLPADADDANLIYESSDETVATVDENGTVTAIGKGECTVTTTCEDKTDVTAETAVTVKIGATGIRLEQGTGGTIAVGGGVKLVARTVPVEADASTYTYKSGNEKVATVNSEGTVTGVSTGSTTITVTSADEHTAEYKVTVAIKCGYCGGFGHTQSNCSVRQADIAKQQAAKAAAAKQQASGGKTGTQNAATGGAAAASGGGGGAPAPAPTPGIVEGPGAGVGQDGNLIIGGGGIFEREPEFVGGY